MKHFISFSLLLLFSSVLFAQPKYGALTVPPSPIGAIDFKVKVAGELGVSCLRDGVQLYGTNNDVRLFNSSYGIVLNINSNNPQLKGAKPFPKDTSAYKLALQKVIRSLPRKPVLIIIENEESNQQNYTGYARDYINELKAAISVGNDEGIPVTNGGLTYNGLLYSLYNYYMNTARITEAKALASKTGLQIRNTKTIQRGLFTDTLIAAYANMKIDVDVHWYQSNTDVSVLLQVIEMLKERTGKNLLSTEAGQYDTAPATITTLLSTFKNAGFTRVIVYDGTGAGGKAKAFHVKDASLAANGDAVRDFIKK